MHNTACSQFQKNWKLTVDNNQAFGTLTANLSKVFDCLPDEFLIAKSNAQGVSFEAD